MVDYFVTSLKSLTRATSAELVDRICKNFSCRNKDVEEFLHTRVREYDESGYGRTYLILNNESWESRSEVEIIAFFTIGISTVDLSGMSKNARKKLLKQFPGKQSRDIFPAYLIGQLGRDTEKYPKRGDFDGKHILEACEEVVMRAQELAAGQVMVIDCEEAVFNNYYSQYGFKEIPFSETAVTCPETSKKCPHISAHPNGEKRDDLIVIFKKLVTT